MSSADEVVDEKSDQTKKDSSTDNEPEEDKPPDIDLPSIKDEPAGLTVKGDWKKITNFCEQFNYTLEEETKNEDVRAEDLENWKDWHPGEGEDEESVKKRSADHAAYEPEIPPEKDLQKSKSRFDSSRKKIDKGKNKQALEDLAEASASGARGLFTHFVRVLGKIERLIYRYVITKTNSSYFDSDLVSANLEEESPLRARGKYRFQVKIHDNKIREKVSAKLKE